VNALPTILVIYALVIGLIVAMRIASKKKWPIEDYWGVFMGLMACSTPIVLGLFFFGYVGAVIGLVVTLWIARQIISSSKKHHPTH
jgi:uncharacterized protein YneF (UPF0154 family)